MLIQFSVENYLSFRTRAVLECTAGTIKEYPDNLFDPILNSEMKLLKSLGIYGANSSGKSNLIKGIWFMRSFVINSFKESQVNEQIPVQPFRLSSSSKEQASEFEVIFLLDEQLFRYGFSLTSNSVKKEWLFQTIKRKEEFVFVRAGKEFNANKKFKADLKGKFEFLADFTRENSLFLSVLAAHNVVLANSLIGWFSRVIVVRDSDHRELINVSASMMARDNYRMLINEIMKRAGLGIDGVEEKASEIVGAKKFSPEFVSFLFQEEAKEYRVKTRHKIFNEEKRQIGNEQFDLLENESSGTQKFFGLLGPILMSLKERRVIIVDELDAKMHTKLLEAIVGLFNSQKYNAYGAQLIFTSHNTYLLKGNFRRDQMVLVDKDQYGESVIGSVHKKFRKVRNDASFDKDYMSGAYKAIPNLYITQLDLFKDE